MVRIQNKKRRVFAKPVARIQKHVEHMTGDKIPKSFVFSRGKLPGPLRQLQMDLRKLMLPHTSLKLKEQRRNNLKDFLNVAGPMGVTNFLILSKTVTGPYLPIIVLSGFGTGDQHQLMTIMFQNIIPAIDVSTVKLSSCQRIVLLNYYKDTKLIDFRHYSIRLVPVGVSGRIRKFVQNHHVPDLRNLQDRYINGLVEENVMAIVCYGSESEADDEAATGTLASDLGRVNQAPSKSAVKLQEIGLRITLHLVKVREGLRSDLLQASSVSSSHYENPSEKKRKDPNVEEKGSSEDEMDNEENELSVNGELL